MLNVTFGGIHFLFKLETEIITVLDLFKITKQNLDIAHNRTLGGPGLSFPEKIKQIFHYFVIATKSFYEMDEKE